MLVPVGDELTVWVNLQVVLLASVELGAWVVSVCETEMVSKFYITFMTIKQSQVAALVKKHRLVEIEWVQNLTCTEPKQIYNTVQEWDHL